MQKEKVKKEYALKKSKNDFLLELVDVNKSFTTKHSHAHVIKDFNLKVKKGEFVIITGPSGSGKSTILNIIAGLESPDKGKVMISGIDFYKLSESTRAQVRSEKLGLIFQQSNWISSLSVLENTILPLLITGQDKKEALKHARYRLEHYKLGKLEKFNPKELSGGEQQRVSLIRALIHNPDIIIADEPTGNLDTHNSDQLMLRLRELHQKEKKTIILVTHNTAYSILGTHNIKIKDGAIVSEEIR